MDANDLSQLCAPRSPSPPLTLENRDRCSDQMLDSLPACISYVDADLRYRFANAAYEDWFQLDRQVIYGRHLWDVIGDEAYQKAKPYIDEVLAGRQITYETVLPYAQGNRYVRCTLTPDLNDQSQVQGFYALIVDISDDKQTEMRLRRSEAALAKAQEIAHIGSWEFDAANQRFDCSAEMLRLLGLAVTAVPPSLSQMAQFFPADDWAQVQQAARRLLATGEAQPFSGHIMRPDGDWRYLEGDSEAITDDRGVVVRDLNSRLLFWSRGAEQIYGWQAEEVLGQNVDKLLNPEGSPNVKDAWQMVLRQGEWQGELVKHTKGGELRTVESRWTLVRDSAGNPEAVLSVDTDITERKQLETQFLRAQRLESLGTLSSGIAHDLNNILTPILGIAQLLPHKLSEAEPLVLELIEILAKSAQRGANLSKQILSFAKGSGGDFTALDLRHLLAEIRRFTQQTFPKSIAIRVELPPDLWLIRGDATHLYQIFMNLCVNARDAMPDGGLLSLTAHNLDWSADTGQAKSHLGLDRGFYVVIEVADTGVGMLPELIDKIFDPFFTTKEPGQGTGLGLSTTAGIIQSHGGQIQVTSQVNQGTHFTISLPAAPITPPLSEETVTLHSGSGELILVVDDEPQICYVTQALLESYNYQVLTACDGVEAIAVYQEHADDIDAVLMDMRMPKMSGAIALAPLQQINPHLKAIMTSGVISKNKLPNRDNLTVHAFLPKPYDVEALFKALSTALNA
jgi:PAS domain S-box-containing protein